MENIYDYVKSVFMPFEYSGNNVSGIPYQGPITIQTANIAINESENHLLSDSSWYEILIVTPSLYDDGTGTDTSSALFAVYCKTSPNTISGQNLENRYIGTPNNRLYSDGRAVSLEKASLYIEVNRPVQYEACMFVKTSSYFAENPDEMFNVHKKYEGNIQINEKLWINTIPIFTEIRSMSNQAYRQGISVHYLIRIKRLNPLITSVYVRKTPKSIIARYPRATTSVNSHIEAKSLPLGFTQYVFEKLRDKYSFIVIDQTNTELVSAKKLELEMDIKTAVNELSEELYGMFKHIGSVNLTKLINFVIFYIE